MSIIRSLKSLYLSFFSKVFYLDFYKNRKDFSFTYLFFVISINITVNIVLFQKLNSNFVETESPEIVAQIPKVSIIKGEVKINKKLPYYIYDENQKKTIMFDSKGTISSLEHTDSGILVTKNKLFLKKNINETRVYDLSAIDHFEFDSHDIQTWLEVYRKWMAVIAFPFVLFFSFSYHILQAFLYALIGLIFTGILSTKMEYKALVRLSVAAVTPVIILDSIIDIFNLQIPHLWLFSFLIAMGYLFFGIKVNADVLKKDSVSIT